MKIVSKVFSKRFLMRAVVSVLFLSSIISVSAQTATNIQVTSAVQQASVKRLGVNLGDETYWDSGQMTKNLVFANPGFEAMKYRSIMVCHAATANTCTDDNNYSPQPTGFWTGGTYSVMSGTATGTSGTIISSTKNPSSCSGCGQIIQFDKNVNMAVGDYFVLTNSFPGNGDAGWWDNISGGGTITSETNDISPNSPGKQAVVMNAGVSGQSVLLTQYFDNENGLSFIQLNGNFEVTFRAKGAGGNNTLTVSVQRLQPTGISNYLTQQVKLTNTWQDYKLTFSASENGSASGTVQLVFNATSSIVKLDDVSLDQTNSSSSNPTAFRDDVVNALKELNPGTIRMMAAGAALGSDIPNQLQEPFARYRMGFSTGKTSQSGIPYGIHEFLQLCQTVGSDPWITIPTATTTAEMTDLIEYLTGTGSDSWSALRIARGQSAPWTSVFNKIHIELGNETWNGQFRGESMNYNAYPGVANSVFGAARKSPGYVASKFDLVLDGLAASPGYNGVLLSASTQHDSIDIAPYLLYSANDEPMSTMYGALFAEAELFNSPGGEVYGNITKAQAAPTPTYVSVYETNLGTMIGGITQAELDVLTPSLGAGLAHTEHMLQMMRIGVQYQNAFALQQFDFLRTDSKKAKLWGIVVDMGTTNRRRPQFLTQALANSAVGGNMLQTVQTGANPTWNQPLSSDSVQMNGAHYLQSFAFQNGNQISTIVFNLSQTSALPVTFSGANAPSGTVQMTQITSANISDNNETSSVVEPATQTLSGFNPTTGLTLPPYSMTVLTTLANTVQQPVFSVPAGTYTAAQTVSISDATSGAAIYYTTDGSVPTTSSTPYTGPISVSKSQTLQAIATASNLSPSSVASAAYVISAATAAAPVFSVAAGTYTTAQKVTITDATAGATIYYTTDGSTPTASSTPYTAALTVSSSTTLKAIAVAANYNTSPVTSASYVISSVVAAPTFSVASGTYTSAQKVTITDATSGVSIYYTTNGTTPTTGSTKYSAAITVSTSQTLKAIAVAPPSTTAVTAAAVTPTSTVSSATYVINLTVATPVFSLAAGTYTTAQKVTITEATPGATIYYTTSGAIPTTSSAKYTGAITVSSTQTLMAMGAETGYASSAIKSAAYVIKQTVATPVISLASGTYTGTQTVKITDATAGATIYYTTTGALPTTSSSKYTGPITVSASETLIAIGASTNYTSSAAAKATYVISTLTPPPTFSVAGGSYTSAQTVSLLDAVAGASIYYTTNGTTPTTSSTKYTAPIAVSSSETIKAIAVATGATASTVSSAAYTITLATATPVFSVASGTYSTTQTLTITDATAGATIYYTTNGTVPTTSSAKYTGPISIAASQTVSAIAVSSGHSNSAVAKGIYVLSAVVGQAIPAGSMQIHGSAAYVNNGVRLTNGGIAQSAVAWTTNAVAVDSFNADFNVQLTTSVADGFTFTLQNAPKGNWEMGNNGSGLGYTGIVKSVAVKFALYDDTAKKQVSVTGLLQNGAAATTQSIDMSGSQISLHTGHILHIHMAYNGTVLVETVTDTTTGAVFTHSYTVNIPSILGGKTGFVGFTASTGAFTAVQNLLTWGYGR